MHGYRADQGDIPSPGISSATLPAQRRTAANSVLAHTGATRCPVVQAPMGAQPPRAHGTFACGPGISALARCPAPKNNNPGRLIARASGGNLASTATHWHYTVD